MRIGKLSRLIGVSQRMIRYYEEQGLLTPARSEANYRKYAQNDVCRLRRIQILQEAGLTLKIIHGLLPCINGEPIRFEKCEFVLETLLIEREKMVGKIRVLSESLDLLNSYLSDVGGGATSPRSTADIFSATIKDYPRPISIPQERGPSKKSSSTATN